MIDISTPLFYKWVVRSKLKEQECLADLRVIAERKNSPKYSLQGFLDKNQLTLPKEKVSKALVNIHRKIEVLGLTEKDINAAIKRARGKKRR